ncbi:MAG: glucose-6-phosphate isomerase [Alphaproteobacteria bacterium]|nr:glucose-6-phosphate isomerase [Alphaproteobacteria bacterium]
MNNDSVLSGAWNRLAALAARPGARDIRARFDADPARPRRFSASHGDMTLDFSKTAIDGEALAGLLDLAHAADLDGFRRRLFAGAMVNATEHRAAMHMALRSRAADALHAGTEDASAIAAHERGLMQRFVAGVHRGAIHGATGEAFDTVVNVGIGGSDLGPLMATEALTMAHGGVLHARFLSNVDGTGAAAVMRELDPERTLVLVASKTFTTDETMTNARALRAWIADSLGEAAVASHFAALSTNLAAVAAFGIADDRVFGFRDWVGGRFSLWSPVGLSIALAAGWEPFQAMLEGGRDMDAHFRDADFADNLPVLLALVGIWHVNAMGYGNQAVLAYDDRLRRFPAFLQQLEMESNGKSVGLDGKRVSHRTCPVIFGEPGTNAQHSFMQLVHQGTSVIPVDFILAAVPDHDRPDAHRILAANALAQAAALLRGKSRPQVETEMRAAGVPEDEIAAIAPHRVFTGDRPSSTIMVRRLDAVTLGRLIALYEHKVAVQGWLWQVNSFDQWGVELGKLLARGILPDLAPGAPIGRHDPSTSALIARFRGLRDEA